MASSLSFNAGGLPVLPLPGSYGPPLLGPLKDRLDYFWFQGSETFFRQRAATYKSTVFHRPRVIAVVDCAAFPALFDLSLVEKRDVLIGDFMPSTDFTGGMRVMVYMDPSEQKHNAGKAFCLDLLKRRARIWVSEFLLSTDVMLTTIEKELSGATPCIFSFLCKSLAGADPATCPEIADCGFAMLDKWLSLQILPTTSIGVLQPLEEIFLHSFAYPFALVKGNYQKLYDFLEKEGGEVIGMATSEYGLTKEGALHNLLFILGFNAFGGFSVFLPTLITTLGRDTTGLQGRLRAEVRRVLAGGRQLGFDTVREMELVQSTVHEVLRMNPPVFLQYGRARKDFLLSSHEASFQVRTGELLCGYEKLAMRDPKVFDDPETFNPDRYMGEKGRRLLDYLYWSNGPQTATHPRLTSSVLPRITCVTACLLVAEIVRRYDDFAATEAPSPSPSWKRRLRRRRCQAPS
ncbi:unnamed protein product [Spirodela intermedia]|uniref:Uncharacterized protein n=1 Tax=Spirodela intermedia TaxID=51605 RepID=A0A7I8IW22_SPIIN|nr:unnamed protein product [Spirodela intermedia]CAA6661350.1 unnamed protein product [Spirodela intermedia]